MDVWEHLQQPGPEAVLVDGVEVRRGSRVRIRPLGRGDVMDQALIGRTAVVEAEEHGADDSLHVAVTLDDDPGRDLGWARLPGHRFFFAVEDIEPLGADADAPGRAGRVLVAGIGNIFFSDDAFGVELAQRLASGPLPPGVEVLDFGIRGFDLAYALQAPYAAVVFLDAEARGDPPGTLRVIEPAVTDDPHTHRQAVDTHGMDPVTVLRLATQLGSVPPRVRAVTCEPGSAAPGDGCSPPVLAALERAEAVVRTVLDELLDELLGTIDEGMQR
jgi:hydrogenase maturation protease